MRLLFAILVAASLSGCPGNVMCIRAVECVSACGMTPVTAAGCGPCPAGTFDVLMCRADAGDPDAPAPADAPVTTDAPVAIDAPGVTDAPTTTDAPASSPDGVACGGLDCDLDERCCSTDSGRACAPASDPCTGAIGIEACDGAEDCGAGEACCVTLDGAGTLVSACGAEGSCPGTAGGDPPWRSCHEDADCAASVECCPSPTPELSASICGIGC